MKPIAQKFIDKAVSSATQHGATIFFSGTVLKHHVTSKGKDERILIISDQFAAYYSKKGDTPNYNYWIDIDDMCFESSMITLKFKGYDDMKFEYDKGTAPDLDQIISETIQRLVHPEEIEKMPGFQNQKNNFKRFYPTCKSMYSRFISHISSRNIKLNDNGKNMVRFILSQATSRLVFSSENIEKVIQYLIDSLRLSTHVESLYIPSVVGTDVFYALAVFLRKPSNIIHIKTSKQEIENFTRFCQSIWEKKDPANQLTALSFVDSDFDQYSLSELSNAISNSKINSLTFENPTNEDGNLEDHFFMSNFPELKLFGLSRMNINNLDNLLQKLSNIKVLSLTSLQNTDIKTIFETVSKANLSSLSFLNVSGNTCKPKTTVSSLPNTLQRLDASFVEFEDNSLVEFFTSIFQKKWKGLFKLSLSNIRASDKEISSLMKKMRRMEPVAQLSHFSWNGNTISEDFFSFLENFDQIKTLFLDCCFLECNSRTFNAFLDVLPALENLIVLSIKGDGSNSVVAQNFPKLCKIIKKSRSIQRLNVSFNAIGDEGISQIQSLIEASKQIIAVAFDGCKVSSIDKIIQMADNISNLKKSIFLDFPSFEIRDLLSRGSAPPNLLDDLRIKLKAAYLKTDENNDNQSDNDDDDHHKHKHHKHGDNNDKYYDSSAFWNMNIEEYKEPTTDEFPEYLTPKLLSVIEKGDQPQNNKNKRKYSNDDDYSESRDDDDDSDDRNKRRRKKNRRNSDSDDSDDNDYEDNDDSSDRNRKKKSNRNNKKSHRNRNSDSDDDDDSDDDYSNRRKRKSSKKINKKSRKRRDSDDSDRSDDDSDEDSDKSWKRRKDKKNKSSKRLAISDDEESDDDSYRGSRKKKSNNKRKRLQLSDDDSESDNPRRRNKKSSKRKTSRDSDSDDDSDDDDSYKNRNKNKSSKRNLKKSRRNLSNSDSENDSDSDSDGGSRGKKSGKDGIWKFPLEMSPNSEKKAIKQLEAKFSIKSLNEAIMS
ncbi:hypothetical protein TRFO_22138 [Tritrichomonas foetus]|uniref:Leucine Rich Repeat family protein n=1 Tax=Tritrichomonas foetus TaxID=1144522 RepID=A0A1J4KHI8_9EUKA|nr:hypothetical protein TRFO_22138 [Tritrichomonas foetus]|eukprot:OHT09126.1 hypothetical protein TRFO_22138 [Tritrichomonas foetus]